MPAAGVLIMLSRLLVMPGVEHAVQTNWGQLMLASAKAQRVYSAARDSHNECTRNTLKHSTCSHKWWETLKGLIFGCAAVYSCSQEAWRWFDGVSCKESVTPGLSV